MQLLDDIGWRALWKKDGVPSIGFEIGHALLEAGRHVRQRGRALLGHDRDWLDGAAVDLRLGGADDLAQIVDPAALKILHRRARATIGHVGDVDTDEIIEQHAAEMGCGAGACRTVLHLRLVRFGISDEFLKVVHRQILARDEHDRHLGNQRNRRKVRRRVIERLLVHGLALCVRADGAEHERVAVGRGIGDALGPRHAAGAADVLHHDLLAEDLAHALGHDAAEHVRRSAGRERNDHRDRLGGIGLRQRHAGHREQDAIRAT